MRIQKGFVGRIFRSKANEVIHKNLKSDVKYLEELKKQAFYTIFNSFLTTEEEYLYDLNDDDLTKAIITEIGKKLSTFNGTKSAFEKSIDNFKLSNTEEDKEDIRNRVKDELTSRCDTLKAGLEAKEKKWGDLLESVAIFNTEFNTIASSTPTLITDVDQVIKDVTEFRNKTALIPEQTAPLETSHITTKKTSVSGLLEQLTAKNKELLLYNDKTYSEIDKTYSEIDKSLNEANQIKADLEAAKRELEAAKGELEAALESTKASVRAGSSPAGDEEA